ncbi:MAG: hypothetical protein D6748_12935 [Calditrichaeota bacterium]|nr:MAG: hypothetical protein D6748_12935 [Calditrichota bacterium]
MPPDLIIFRIKRSNHDVGPSLIPLGKVLPLLIFFLSLMFLTVTAQNISPTSSEIHLIYTGNISGALDDCGCDEVLAGGLTRISTIINEFRQREQNLLVVDGGDFLNSYSTPRANRMVIRLLPHLGYDALNIGDQEFVETTDFWERIDKPIVNALSLVSANISWVGSPSLHPYVIKKLPGARIAITGLVERAAFEFIQPRDIQLTPVNKAMKRIERVLTSSSDLQIVLFHGNWSGARQLVEHFPWIDVIVLSHSQKQRVESIKNTILVECGSEGEYIGHLQMKKEVDGWSYTNEFIPVEKRIHADGELKKIVDKFYQGY